MVMPTLKNVPNCTEKLQYKVNGTTMVTKGAFSGLVCSNAASKCRNKGMNGTMIVGVRVKGFSLNYQQKLNSCAIEIPMLFKSSESAKY